MDKKVFTLATTRCGYCKMTKTFIESTFPEVLDNYIYFNYDQDDITPEADTVLKFAANFGIKSVPITVLFEDDEIKTAVRGYVPDSLSKLIKGALTPSKPKQMEIPFPKEEKDE